MLILSTASLLLRNWSQLGKKEDDSTGKSETFIRTTLLNAFDFIINCMQ